jgi:hypothetical protein
MTDICRIEGESVGKPTPGEDFLLPASPKGIVLLKAFADAHPGSFNGELRQGEVHGKGRDR